MKMLPSGSQVTSVGCRNCPSIAGRGGFTRVQAPPSSEASFLRPNTIVTRPSGLNLITISEPLSTAQMLSSLSVRTVCAKDQAYRLWPISRTNLPFWSNSRICAAVAPYAGPVVLPRLKTKMCFFDLTATPDASPRCKSVGNLKKSGTESNLISDTGPPRSAANAAGLNAAAPTNAKQANRQGFMETSFVTQVPYHSYQPSALSRSRLIRRVVADSDS